MPLHHSSAIALHNGSVAPGSCSGVRRRGPVRLLAAVVACCAAFAIELPAHAQILPGGPISGNIVWNDTTSWTSGLITNTTTGSFSGNPTFQFSAPYTVSSGSIFLTDFLNQAQRVTTFAASTGTQTITFNANTGFRGGQNNYATSSQFASSLILSLNSGRVTFNFPTVRSSSINSQITGAGTFRITGDANRDDSIVTLTNTANNWTGGLINEATLIFSSSNALPSGIGYGSFTNNGKLFTGSTVQDSASSYRRVNNLSGTGTISHGSNTNVASTIAVLSLVSSTYSGGISNSSLERNRGTMSLVKQGEAMLALTGTTNWYSGITDVQSGTLDINTIRNAGVSVAPSTYSVSGNTVTPVSMQGINVGMRIFYGDLTNNFLSETYVTAITGSNFTTSSAISTTVTNGLRLGFGSPLGMSTSAASNLVLNGGNLRYSGSASGTTNRLFSIGTGGGGIIADGTTGVLLFTNTATLGTANMGSGARTFTLSGTNTGTNTLNAVIVDGTGSGATSLVKTGVGRWVLGGINTYTGTTRIESGTLVLGAGGSIGSSRRVIVGTAANSSSRLVVTDASYTFNGVQTLMGSGTVEGSGGTITIGGTLAPGNSPGLLTFDNTSVVLSSTANTIMEIQGDTRGTLYDAIDILGTGDLTYGGTLTLDFSQVFTSGTFNLFRFDTSSGLFANVVATGSMVGTFTNSGSGVWTATAGQQQLTFRQQVDVGGTNYGQLVIVPEPLMLGLLGIASGVAVVGIRHVRRRRQSGGSGDAS
jgi:autotransporter-associated beta strand protein